MARPSVSKRIESALERGMERPFLRRARVSLPLLKGSLRRAMHDEVKAVVPSRYTITVSAEQLQHLDSGREEWEAELVAYFLQLLRENSWSAIGEPSVVIAYDPELHGVEARVAVEEPGLIYNGGPLRARRPGNQVATTLGFVVAFLLGVLILLALLRPDLLGDFRGSLPQPAQPAEPLVLPWTSAQEEAESWWENMRSAILGRTSGEILGEVVAAPCLAVRAGEPSTGGATLPERCIPRGTALGWRNDQVVRGEPFRGEDRWLEIGRAGPEWGTGVGKKLYIWMGGVQQR